MNFLTRLFDLIFNKDRAASPAAERVQNKAVEPPCSEPGSDAVAQRASASQRHTGRSAEVPDPSLDLAAAESAPIAADDNIMPVRSAPEQAPSAREALQRQTSAPVSQSGASVSEPTNPVAGDSNPAVEPEPPDTPKPIRTPESVEKLDAIEKPDSTTNPETAAMSESTEKTGTAGTASSRSAEAPAADASSQKAQFTPQKTTTQKVTTENATAQADKHDIDAMKNACETELKKKRSRTDIPVPYFFERTAILSRKEKNYSQEIDYCERYINMTDAFYKKHGIEGLTDIRNGAKHRAIVERLPKARALLQKQQDKKS